MAKYPHPNKFLITSLFIFSLQLAASLKCPERCICRNDSKGRKLVECDAGSVGSGIPVFDMDRGTQILLISSEESQPQVLNVGPIFSPLSQLEEVHITMANVPNIGENSFWGLKHLRLLNLTHNNVSSIKASHLAGMRTLQALHLDDNRIDSVASATFMALEKLEILTLANNRLRGLNPRVFFLLSSLKTLDLSGNPIRELDPEVLKDLNSLRVLRCARCELTRIRSQVYKKILELEELDLRENKIEILSPEEYIDLRYLKALHLDGNRLFELRDYVFKGLGLRVLGISRNHMEKISRRAFEDCSMLSLDISSNKLSYSSLRHITPVVQHVHDLNLSNNKIHVRHIRDLLKKATRLNKLNISRMHLNQLLPDMFSTQSKLEVLNVSKNNIKYVPVDILHTLPSLFSLDVSRNEIRGFPEIILRRLDRIRDLHLNNNPWSCDQCHIPHFKNWINNSKEFRDACNPNVDAPKCLKCQYPAEMYDKPIIEVDGLSLQPCPDGSFDLTTATAGSSTFTLVLAIITACVVILLLVVILIVGIIMYNRHTAIYYTHEDDARKHFYDNSALHSNHTDVTMADDLPPELHEIIPSSVSRSDITTTDPSHNSMPSAPTSVEVLDEGCPVPIPSSASGLPQVCSSTNTFERRKKNASASAPIPPPTLFSTS